MKTFDRSVTASAEPRAPFAPGDRRGRRSMTLAVVATAGLLVIPAVNDVAAEDAPIPADDASIFDDLSLTEVMEVLADDEFSFDGRNIVVEDPAPLGPFLEGTGVVRGSRGRRRCGRTAAHRQARQQRRVRAGHRTTAVRLDHDHDSPHPRHHRRVRHRRRGTGSSPPAPSGSSTPATTDRSHRSPLRRSTGRPPPSRRTHDPGPGGQRQPHGCPTRLRRVRHGVELRTATRDLGAQPPTEGLDGERRPGFCPCNSPCRSRRRAATSSSTSPVGGSDDLIRHSPSLPGSPPRVGTSLRC